MGSSFHRKWKVSIGPLSTDALRVQFRVSKTLEKEPNALDLKVTNLAEVSRGKLTGAALPVVLEAGYDGAQAIIFSGDSRTIDHVRTHAEWITHCQCGDGEQVYQFARVNQNFAKGASVSQVIQAVAKALSVNPGNLQDALNKATLPFQSFNHGYVAQGRASDVLHTLLKSVGLSYSIQQGALQVIKPGEPSSQTVFKLTPQSGLVGSPDHTPPDHKTKPATLKLRCLLNPQLRPGNIIDVESVGVKGLFIIQKLDHVGDSHGADWLTVMECYAKP